MWLTDRSNVWVITSDFHGNWTGWPVNFFQWSVTSDFHGNWTGWPVNLFQWSVTSDFHCILTDINYMYNDRLADHLCDSQEWQRGDEFYSRGSGAGFCSTGKAKTVDLPSLSGMIRWWYHVGRSVTSVTQRWRQGGTTLMTAADDKLQFLTAFVPVSYTHLTLPTKTLV